MATFDHTQIARLATGLYATQIGNTTMQWALDSVNGHAYGSVAGLANALYARDFAGMSDADLAARVVANVGITGADQVAEATAIVTGALGAAAAGQKGQTVLDLINAYANLTAAEYADAVAGFNKQITVAEAYAMTLGTADVPLAALTPVFHLDDSSTIAGLQSMHLTGNQDVRINLSNTANQITGLDLNGDGVIAADGVENKITGRASGFEAVDAYSRNPWNHKDTANNFLGDIDFDGRSYQGDGVKTNGNIVLGGLGGDTIYGGVGNDFLAGGGLAQGSVGKHDYLSGGRNADFFFAEFSAIGNPSASLEIDGGNTADDNSAGNGQSAQDSDWLLLEANDDDEPVQIWLNDDNLNDQRDAADGLIDNKGRVLSRAGDSMVIDDVENVDASGNLYGFLNNIDVLVGKRAMDARDAGATTSNFGYGSAAQLWISGSKASNIIIGGYDNDYIEGRDGNDLLMGGNLNFNHDPNLSAIINNGRDELVGGAGDDNLVFETDGGIYEGDSDYDADGGNSDTLWLTRETFGTQNAATVTADGFVRMDLGAGLAGGLALYAGYGGADKAAATGRYTSDQTNYKAGYLRTQVQDMENVIATGLGAVDYKAAGANSPNNASAFDNQQNHYAYVGNLDLRGTNGANTLYAAAGTDIIEGREGNDKLSGGDGNDDFYFSTLNAGDNGHDGVDVIHRQSDANGDNLWDTDADGNVLYERDFNIGGTSTTGASALTVDLQTTDLSSADVALTSFSIKIGGTTFAVVDAAALMAANSAAEVAALVNTAFHAQDAQVSATAVGNTIVVKDLGGRDISDTVAEGYAVGGVVSNGAFAAQAVYGPADTLTTKDRLIYKSYEDRADNEGTDDDSFLGSYISLGTDAYAEDLVIWFGDEDGDGAASTRIAEDQTYTIKFTNLTTQDKVTVAVNGVNYTLQVGVDLDGNIIAAEDGVGDTQAGIQAAFLARLNTFINTFMDDDTTAGAVDSAYDGVDTLTLTQRDYNGEETVFMSKPTVTLQNLSGGEPASAVVTNVSQHELELLDFDGRDGQLNETNVLFVGQEFVSRAELSTAKNAGGTQTGTEALVIDVGANNLQDMVYGTTTAIPNNTASNSPLAGVPNGVAVHGDDFLLGGNGLDVISGGTGDDRVEGSIGGNGTTTWDVLDGGKNFYAVQVLGEPQARVYILNKWEAANPTRVDALKNLTISSLTLIDQSENGTGTSSGVFDDTLQFSQRNFTAGTTRFTVALNDFVVNGGVVELRNDGAGTVGVDVDDNGTLDNWTKFTNFENIRTVSGTGNAVAGDGQGNDTLDVTLLSSKVTGAGGIHYNLTNDDVIDAPVTSKPGEVRYSANTIIAAAPDSQFPNTNDYEALVIKVDGVENVIASDGDDMVVIDETEAAKNNSFTAGRGVDRIQYLNVFAGDVGGVAEPTVTIKVDNIAAGDGGVDTVTMTGGRVGTTVATDSLGGVEFITLSNNTATGSREDDVLDVTSMTTGAVVSYVDGTVKDLGGVTHVTIQGIDEIENVWGDGNDTVIVADATVMGGNTRSDAGTLAGADDKDISFATFVDFDTLKDAGTDNSRLPFASQSTAQIEDVINQFQFKFNLSKTGTGADTDTVDYSNAVDNIAVVVELDATKPNQYVLVDSDGATFYSGVGDLEEAGDRIDTLTSVERIVASQGESVLDLSGSTKGLEIKWSAYDVANQTAALDRDMYTVRISDLTTASPLQRTFVEYRDAGLSATVAQPQATWNRVEGSDNAEVIVMNSAHAMDADTFNLRGGANQVKYNELTKSITLTLGVNDFVAATPLTTGRITGDVQFQDGTGAGVEGPMIAGSQHHTITSYTANNGIASGSLRVAASQDAEDTLKFFGLDEKVFLLAETGTVDNQITVKLGSGTAANSVILTGFELVSDSTSNDIYDFGSLVNAAAGLNFIDAGPDHDTIKVGNDAVGRDGTNALGGGAVVVPVTEISLQALRDDGTLATAGFDFDVLDITKVTDTAVTTVTGASSALADFNTDEVVFGKIMSITSALAFESVVLTQATITENGTTFKLDTTANSLIAGSKTVALTNGTNTLSFGGTVLEQKVAPDHLRAATDLNATSGVTVTVVGNEAVNITGGNGDDVITSNGGNDTLRGGSGNDTLNGGFTAAVGATYTVQLAGATATSGAALSTMVIGGVTLTTSAAPVLATDIAVSQNYLQIANRFKDVPLATWQLALDAAGLSTAEANALTSVTHDGNGGLVFSFSTAATTLTNTILGLLSNPAVTGTAVLGATESETPYTAATESQDTYVFEATAALNGLDTINNFNATGAATDDVLDFRAFLGTALTDSGAAPAATNFATQGLNLSAGGNGYGVVYNKGALAAADIAQVAAAGKVAVELNSKAVVIATADVDGQPDATNDAYSVYFVTVGATAADVTVTKVATLNSNSELNPLSFQGITSLTGTAGDDTLAGSGGSDFIDGLAGNDTITGNAGNDTITGNAGNDVLTGGTGTDTFVFSGVTALTNGADVISDFTPADDTMQFSVAAVNAATGAALVAGAVPAGNIVIAPAAAAADGDDYFLYDTVAGTLSFDADGNGAGAAVVLATLTGAPVITAADVVLA